MLIDDAGMCMEPETMIPIVCTGSQQVILLGDQQELQPGPHDPSSQRPGHPFKQSLLERYATRAQVILNTQYRMVSILCLLNHCTCMRIKEGEYNKPGQQEELVSVQYCQF